MDQELEYQELTGTIETVIFKNEENGYTVLRLRADSGETVTVVGTFPYAPSSSWETRGNSASGPFPSCRSGTFDPSGAPSGN